jgi:Tol biopolymer transport system component
MIPHVRPLFARLLSLLALVVVLALAAVPASSAARSTPAAPSAPRLAPAWSPDGETIAYATGHFPYLELRLVSPDGTKKRAANAHFTTRFGPSWSPDGHSLAFTNGADIFVMDLDHTEPRRITPDINNNMLAENDVRWSLP